MTNFKKFGALDEMRAMLKSRVYLAGARRGHGVRVYGKLVTAGRSGINIGANVVFAAGQAGTSLTVQPGAILYIGAGSRLDSGCIINVSQLVHLGQRCQIGKQVIILDSDHHGLPLAMRRTAPKPAPVIIEDDVWIGDRAVILPGVRLGAGSVVAAGSIVTADVAPFTVVAGVPAKRQDTAVARMA